MCVKIEKVIVGQRNLAHIKSLGSLSTTSITSFLFRRTKSTVSRIQFSARYKTEVEKSHNCQHGRMASD